MTDTAGFIGIDIGTGSVKALLVGSGGRIVDSYGADYPTHHPAPGAAEQDPADWTGAVFSALEQFSNRLDSFFVAGIGITSQVNTHVFCDAHGRALAPAITWRDTRPGAPLEGQMTDDEKIAALGAPIPFDASHALSRLAWVEQEQPDVFARTVSVFAPKDFVIHALTGARVADPIASIGLVGPDHQYAEAVLDLVPRARGLLPPLRDPLAIAGHVRAGLPFEGTPVSTGTMDAWASMFGLGVAQNDQAMYLSGTSEVLGLISPTRTGAPGVVTFPDWRGITFHAAPTQSGGASLLWAARLLGVDPGAIGALAAQAKMTAASPLFLPHLAGERAPIWDPSARGVLAGLGADHGPEDIAFAVLEGVAFSARLALEAIERSADTTIDTLAYGGGGARSDVWGQIRATVLGRGLSHVETDAPGALGAAVLAGVSAGRLDDLATATTQMVRPGQTFEPDRGLTDLALERYSRFKDVYHAMAPINPRWSC